MSIWSTYSVYILCAWCMGCTWHVWCSGYILYITNVYYMFGMFWGAWCILYVWCTVYILCIICDGHILYTSCIYYVYFAYFVNSCILRILWDVCGKFSDTKKQLINIEAYSIHCVCFMYFYILHIMYISCTFCVVMYFEILWDLCWNFSNTGKQLKKLRQLDRP